MLVLRNERRVRGMVGREELRALREELEAVDVAERAAQRQRREQGEDGGADEKPLTSGKSTLPPFQAYFADVIAR